MSRAKAIWGVIVTAAGILITGCATLEPGAARVTTACADTRLSIYFDDNSAELTAPARALIASAGARAAKCPVRGVEVVGLADWRGAADANLALSRQRAQAVADALQKSGLPAPSFTIDAKGEAGAVAEPGVAVPMRRAAEVYIRYAAP